MKHTVNTVLVGASLALLTISCGSKNKQAKDGDNSTTQPKVTQQQNQPPQGGSPPKGGDQQGGPPNFSQLLSEMDTNKDGKLEKAEIKGPLADDFTKVDSNNDGFISEEEFKNAPRPERNGPR